MLGHDAQRTGQSPFYGPTAAVVLAFNFTAGFAIGPPAIGADGTLYFGVDPGSVYALDGATGAVKWIYNAPPINMSRYYFDSSPAIGVDGTVFMGSSDGDLYALDGTTGILKWMFSSGNSVSSSGLASPAIGPDGTVYFVTFEQSLFALDGATGTLKWSFPVQSRYRESTQNPAVATDGTVYINGDGGNVVALDGATGAIKWGANCGVNGGVAGLAIGVNGTVVCGSLDQSVYAVNVVEALDSATGAVKWTYSISGLLPLRSSPAIGVDGTVYIVSFSLDGPIVMLALDGSTGALKWKSPLEAPIFPYSYLAIDANGTLFSTGSALDGATGDILFTFSFSSCMYGGGPVIGADGLLYIAGRTSDNRGCLYALK
jgi:outer membrane protein assembly factor BamB